MVYKIESTHYAEKCSMYVASDLSAFVMECLVVYVMFLYDKMGHEVPMGPQEMGDVLHEIYGFEVTEPSDDFVALDLYYLWERYLCDGYYDGILAIRAFRRDGLRDKLAEVAGALTEELARDVRLSYAMGGNGRLDKNCWPFRIEDLTHRIWKGTSWSDVGYMPDVIPDPGYELEGWYLDDGTRLEDDTRIMCDQRITARFRKIPA